MKKASIHFLTGFDKDIEEHYRQKDYSIGYFQAFQGHDSIPINGRFLDRWYLNGDNMFNADNIYAVALDLN